MREAGLPVEIPCLVFPNLPCAPVRPAASCSGSMIECPCSASSTPHLGQHTQNGDLSPDQPERLRLSQQCLSHPLNLSLVLFQEHRRHLREIPPWPRSRGTSVVTAVRAWNLQRADHSIPPSPDQGRQRPIKPVSSASHPASDAPPHFHITYMSRISSDERAWSRTPSPFKDPDAGLKGVDHYQTRLPRWRYRIRQYLIPIVRAETPSLAAVQRICRSPVLDSYFAMSANLGTHTFFMAALPICFWCGYPGIGIALVHMLALGVYFSGYVKDLLCLPRPLSPPLQRITMSGSAALEYGFPSTHTTNAVSAAAFCLYQLYGAKDEMSPSTYSIATGVFYCYALSISVGRIYCGMHGWFDVAVGGILGALITWMRVSLGPIFDAWIMSGDWSRPAIASIVLALAIRFHAEPADNCPCFDDSVAFLGVLMGIEIGVWHHSAGDLTFLDNTSDGNWADNTPEGLAKGVIKVVLGIFVIFLWRAIMKPLCLRGLPPIFRFVDHWGFRLPRRYFLQAR